jgi:hypothetical protein
MEPDINNLEDQEKEELARLMEKLENGKPNPESLPAEPTDRGFGEAPPPNPAVVTRVLDPKDWVDKQIDTMTAVGRENYLRGIKHPKKDPIKAGIAAQGKYEAKMKDPNVLARRKTQLQKTNIDEWVAMAETLGADKIVDGVVKRRFKIERWVAKYQPLLKTHLAAIDAMPDVTEADREAKMLANKRGLQKLKGKA